MASEKFETAIEEGGVEFDKRVLGDVLVIFGEEAWFAFLLTFGLDGIVSFTLVVKNTVLWWKIWFVELRASSHDVIIP